MRRGNEIREGKERWRRLEGEEIRKDVEMRQWRFKSVGS